ncbi:Transposon Ty3-I Gag-Pol polyprotein, partial [Linum perenne]
QLEKQQLREAREKKEVELKTREKSEKKQSDTPSSAKTEMVCHRARKGEVERRENLLATRGEIKQTLTSRMPLVVIVNNECLNSDYANVTDSLPSVISSLLQEFEDVFPEETPKGLPSIRGIEHQIDFVPGASIPNKAAYRTNSEETKEPERQVDELMDKGHVRESMSPCAIPVILVPKKDKSWRMCVDCRTINNITESELMRRK